jgi:hypothetical protein
MYALAGKTAAGLLVCAATHYKLKNRAGAEAAVHLLWHSLWLHCAVHPLRGAFIRCVMHSFIAGMR